MAISNSSKFRLLSIIAVSLLASCRDENPVCKTMKLNPRIVVTNYQPGDRTINHAYLISYMDNFITKEDSVLSSHIINAHRNENLDDKVILEFEIELNTKNNYLLVLNDDNFYRIHNYIFSSDSTMIGLNFKKRCMIKSMMVNDKRVYDIGTTLQFPKEIGVNRSLE